jgi:hypothetical protein
LPFDDHRVRASGEALRHDHHHGLRGFDALDPQWNGCTPNKIDEQTRAWICAIARCAPDSSVARFLLVAVQAAGREQYVAVRGEPHRAGAADEQFGTDDPFQSVDRGRESGLDDRFAFGALVKLASSATATKCRSRRSFA